MEKVLWFHCSFVEVERRPLIPSTLGSVLLSESLPNFLHAISFFLYIYIYIYIFPSFFLPFFVTIERSLSTIRSVSRRDMRVSVGLKARKYLGSNSAVVCFWYEAVHRISRPPIMTRTLWSVGRFVLTACLPLPSSSHSLLKSMMRAVNP